MLHDHTIDGLPVRTSDILCTRDGSDRSLYGRVWKAIGALVPGEIDHCALYLGPGSRFVEADARGVSVLEMPGANWDAHALVRERLFLDSFVGVASPLTDRGLAPADEDRMREAVAAYCLQQVAAGRPFNFDLLDGTDPERAYCSQLIAEAYRSVGIELDSNIGAPSAAVFRHAVFPEELWNASTHRRVGEDPQEA